MNSLSYVLITPARNEASYIELTIKSVVSQTAKPVRWIIVSDGSTDGTDDLVRKYAEEHQWIELVRMPEREERHFAGKTYAFNAGYEKVKDLKYDIIGNVDADTSFDKDYFSFLLGRFAEDKRLGVGGTPYLDGTSQYDYRFASTDFVAGACQLFRRECFEEIGGYTPISGGGIDWTAVTTARMKGWHTRTFIERTYIHHRKSGTGQGTLLASRFRAGKEDYYLGSHPLWEIFRCAYQMRNKPRVLGGIFLLSGYVWGFLSGVQRPISRELARFHQREQMMRLKDIFLRYITGRDAKTGIVEINIKGRPVRVPSVEAAGRTIIINGKLLKIASVRGEAWLEEEAVKDPDACIEALRKHKPRADIFTFAQKFPDSEPKYSYPMEWDNVAAIHITTFDDWWKHLRSEARTKFRKPAKMGITAKVAGLDDKLIKGIMGIYNETPVRQGKPFWHYGKGFDTVKKENATYLGRSCFIGAYLNGEMTGYLKFVNNGGFADIMQILSLIKHRDKAPTNALVAKAVETCAQERIPYLLYGKYIYGKKGADSLTEFKRSSGFQKMDIPRYYIPLTLRGRLALKLGIHRGLKELLPKKLLLMFIMMRNKNNERKSST